MRKVILAFLTISIMTSQAFAVSTLELQGKIDPVEAEVTQSIEDAKLDIVDKAYPVGSIYTTTEDIDASDMSEMIGGTWKRMKNTFLWSESGPEIGSIGGKAEYELSAVVGSDNEDEIALAPSGINFTPNFALGGTEGFSPGGFSGSVPITEMGSSNRTIRFMPPYLAVRMFRRVS